MIRVIKIGRRQSSLQGNKFGRVQRFVTIVTGSVLLSKIFSKEGEDKNMRFIAISKHLWKSGDKIEYAPSRSFVCK